MKNIEIDDELYQYIVTNTQHIGESASSILRRLLNFPTSELSTTKVSETASQASASREQVKAQSQVQETSKEQNTYESTNSAQLANQAKGSVFDHINTEEMADQRGAVGRFLLILAALYRVHEDNFSVVYDIRGRGRLYFANNREDLEQSGTSTKPRQIPNSPYWVITNSNTTRKKMMLTKVAKSLGYSEQQIEKIHDLL